jgi:hypothetical protein
MSTMSEPGPTTRRQDLLAAALAALGVFGAGLLVMLGWAWMGVLGGLLGGLAAVLVANRWYKEHGTVFPRDLAPSAVGGLAAIDAIIGVLLVLTL